MFLESWDNITRVMLVGVLAYGGLVILLRISGNRTLSKMNSFDLVVTVAFGSTLSTILVNRSVSLAVGLVALALLVFLQFAITWTSARSRFVAKIVKTAPTVVVWDGQLQRQAMQAVRITADEVNAAVRQKGYGSLDAIDAIILESDGSLSIVARDKAGNRSAYDGLRTPG